MEFDRAKYQTYFPTKSSPVSMNVGSGPVSVSSHCIPPPQKWLDLPKMQKFVAP